MWTEWQEHDARNITEGHYCPEWDYMFVRPGTPEMEACTCEGVYKGEPK